MLVFHNAHTFIMKFIHGDNNAILFQFDFVTSMNKIDEFMVCIISSLCKDTNEYNNNNNNNIVYIISEQNNKTA